MGGRYIGKLQWTDVVITLAATSAAAYLAVAGTWVRGNWRAAAAFAGVALGPPVFRWLSHRFSDRRAFDVIASFWMLPAAFVVHENLGPVIDAAQPRLWDRYLALADLRLFGDLPARALDHRVPGWLLDALMLCYYTYYVWPVLLGFLLYRRSSRAVFDQFTLAISLSFALTFLGYVLVPAIGPRFYLAASLGPALDGGQLTPYLESLMRYTPFTRDCFPSGHTAITLLVLGYAFLHERRWFWFILPFACGLFAATLVGRFHYGVDLLAAVPLAATVAVAAAAMSRAKPEGVLVPTGRTALQASIRA